LSLIVFLAALLSLLPAACGGTSSPAPPSPSATEAGAQPSSEPASPTPAGPQLANSHPSGTRVGIIGVDHFLALVDANDLAAIVSEAVFSPEPCEVYFFSPPCEPGRPQGSLRSVFSFSSCAINFVLSKEALRDRLTDAWRPPVGLFGVLRLAKPWVRAPTAQYLVVLQRADRTRMSVYVTESGGMAAVTFCDQSEWPPGDPDAEIVLPPRA